ncbi:MAG TPA: NAD(+) synthase [Thermoclostridium sp.]
MLKYGFVRVGAAVPEMKVADCRFNTMKIIEIMEEAKDKDVYLTVFPELCITGYTCGDLFQQSLLLDMALKSLKEIADKSSEWNNIFIVGLPLLIEQQLYNCAAVIQKGKIRGIVPKRYIPNYNEFYEKRWFREGRNLTTDFVKLFGQEIPCGDDLIFQDELTPELSFAVEICEDLWMPVPPSSIQAKNGAVILCNLSASNEVIGKNEYRKVLVKSQSGRCIAAYVYTSAGIGESTTDLVFGGQALIAENGTILAQSQRFKKGSQLIVQDIDVKRLYHERVNSTSFTQSDFAVASRKIILEPVSFELRKLLRKIDRHPFIPSDSTEYNERCSEIFSIQTTGLAKRMTHTGLKKLVLGISGGLDSTLALLVAGQTVDMLDLPRKNIIAITMPGFGTTGRTYENALNLMKSMGVDCREIDIKASCLQHFRDIGHDPDVYDVTYENVQARERTQILMDIANKEGGLVIGTGDLSEMALGWSTYNGDHMSMYSVNCSIPKTLVKHIVIWFAENAATEETARILKSIADTPISPELTPPDKDGEIQQKTEDIIGPYELHDFFLYYMIRYRAEPEKILYLAQIAFENQYDGKTIKKWLKVFYKRFFSQQFKRSCVPDGPKVGTVSLSPRGDWRMPSDASAALWLDQIDTE